MLSRVPVTASIGAILTRLGVPATNGDRRKKHNDPKRKLRRADARIRGSFHPSVFRESGMLQCPSPNWQAFVPARPETGLYHMLSAKQAVAAERPQFAENCLTAIRLSGAIPIGAETELDQAELTRPNTNSSTAKLSACIWLRKLPRT